MESANKLDFAKLRSEGGVKVVWLIDKFDGSKFVQHNLADGTYSAYKLGGDSIVDHGQWTMEDGSYKEHPSHLETPEFEGVLHGDSSDFHMVVECGPHGTHKYSYTSEQWIRGHTTANAVDLSLARQELPIAHMLPDGHLANLAQISAPAELSDLGALKYMANFDNIQVNEAFQVVAVSAKPFTYNNDSLPGSDDLYIRSPRIAIAEVETLQAETLTLKTPVDTKGITVLSWLQQLLTEVSQTTKALATEALASKSPLQELFGKFPVCVISLVCRVRFTKLVEHSLGEGQVSSLTSKVQSVASDMKEALKSEQDPTRRWQLELFMPIVIFQEKSAERLQQVAENAPFARLWDVWRQYIRHYECNDKKHPVVVKCGRAEIPYGFQYRGCDLQLVLNESTHKTYFETLNNTLQPGSRSVVMQGLAGASMTEMQRDLIEVELGYKSVTAKTWANGAGWGLKMIGGIHELGEQEWINRVEQAALANPEVGLIFEYANRCEPSVLNSLVRKSAAWVRTIPTILTLHRKPSEEEARMTDSSDWKCWDVWKALNDFSFPEEVAVIEACPITDPSHFESVIEVLLASKGFVSAARTAQSGMAFINWCRDNIPNQFYSFTSKDIKDVYVSTFNQCTKSLQHGLTEEACMTRALCASLFPQLTPGDSARAAEHMRLMFASYETTNLSLIRDSVPDSVHTELQLIAQEGGEEMERNLGGFFLTAEMKHGIGVVTSTPHRTLKCLSMCAAVIGRQLVYIGYGHCQMGISYLYGKRRKDGKWVDGVLTLAIRRAVTNDVPTWIVLDGPVVPEIMEPLHSLLDVRKRLWLPNDQSIHLTDNVRIIFLMDAESASNLAPETSNRIAKVNLLGHADTDALQLLACGADSADETTLKRKRELSDDAVTSGGPKKHIVRMKSNDDKWTRHSNVDMCGQGDIKHIPNWKSKTTVEALKYIVEQKGWSAFTISTGEPSFGHAALKNFNYQLTAAHCKPSKHPCTIYIYHPDGVDEPEETKDLTLEAPPSALQRTDSSSQLRNPANNTAATLGGAGSIQDSAADRPTLIRTKTEDLNEAITQLTEQILEENSQHLLLRVDSEDQTHAADAIAQLTQQLTDDNDTAVPAKTSEAALVDDSMPEFSLEDIEKLLCPIEDALHEAVRDGQESAAAASSECTSVPIPVLQQCSSEVEGLCNLDVRVQQMPQVGPYLNAAPSMLEPAPAASQPQAPYMPMQMHQMQQYQLQQYQMQQYHMMQMQQAQMMQMMQAQMMQAGMPGRQLGEDMYVGKSVVMIAGKYRGRKAFVECRLKQKYRVKVEGVNHHLEFYSKQFAIPQQPK